MLHYGLGVIIQRHMYTFRPMGGYQSQKNFFFLQSYTNLFTTCEDFEGEEKYFNACCTEYGAISSCLCPWVVGNFALLMRPHPGLPNGWAWNCNTWVPKTQRMLSQPASLDWPFKKSSCYCPLNSWGGHLEAALSFPKMQFSRCVYEFVEWVGRRTAMNCT